MYCVQCGKQIADDSKYCQFCGTNIVRDESESDQKGHTSDKKTDIDKIWDQFYEIYTSEGKTREEYVAITPNAVWELISRLGKNIFEKLLEDNKRALNKEPYKLIESLENAFTQCAIAGYWIRMAENKVQGKNPRKPKNIDIDQISERWKSEFDKSLKNSNEVFSESVDVTLTNFRNAMKNLVMENNPNIKNLTIEVVENIENTMLLVLIGGYFVGVVEDEYRV